MRRALLALAIAAAPAIASAQGQLLERDGGVVVMPQGSPTSTSGGNPIFGTGPAASGNSTTDFGTTTTILWVVMDCPNGRETKTAGCDLALKGKDGRAVWLPNKEWCEAALKVLFPPNPRQFCAEIRSTSSSEPVPIRGKLRSTP